MFELKPLSQDAIASALTKAERYRLLNEPEEAESICHDILALDPSHQAALTMLILAITDQFQTQISGNVARAQGLLARLTKEYDRLYLGGIICERRAKAYLTQGGSVQASAGAYEWLREAMRLFEAAEHHRPAGNDDAVLRWNACVRALERHPQLRPEPDDQRHAIMSE